MYNKRPSDDDDERRYPARSHKPGSPSTDPVWARSPQQHHRSRPPPHSQPSDGLAPVYDNESGAGSSRDLPRFSHQHDYRDPSRSSHPGHLYHSHHHHHTHGHQPTSPPYAASHPLIPEHEDGRHYHPSHQDRFGDLPPLRPGNRRTSNSVIPPPRGDRHGKSKQNDYGWSRQPQLPAPSSGSAHEAQHRASHRPSLEPSLKRGIPIGSPPYMAADTPPPLGRYADPYYDDTGAVRLPNHSHHLRPHDEMMNREKRQRREGDPHDRNDFAPTRPLTASPKYPTRGLAAYPEREVERRSGEGSSPVKAHSSNLPDSYASNEAGLDSSTGGDDTTAKSKRRKRAILSCTECKQRKIKCDRNVPNCGSCVRRGVAHLCRWGDERDNIAATQTSSITPSNAALMAKIAQLESQIRYLQATGTCNHESCQQDSSAASATSEGRGKRSRDGGASSSRSAHGYRGGRSSRGGSRSPSARSAHSDTQRRDWDRRDVGDDQRDASNELDSDADELAAAEADELAGSGDEINDGDRSEKSGTVVSGAENTGGDVTEKGLGKKAKQETAHADGEADEHRLLEKDLGLAGAGFDRYSSETSTLDVKDLAATP